MTGRELRGRVDAFQDVLTDIEAFLEGQKKMDWNIRIIIDRMSDDCEQLFYLIPLENGKK